MPDPIDDLAADSPDDGSIHPSDSSVSTKAPESAGDDPLPPPPSFGRQMAQLVIIPAMIVIACIGVAVLFGLLAGRQQNIEAYLNTLQSTGGLTSGSFDANLPRVQERGRAAYNIATMIPSIDDAERRREISDRLILILEKNVHPDEAQLQQYLLIAVGQLGQEGGLFLIQDHLGDSNPLIVSGAIHALLAWPDHRAAALATSDLIKVLERSEDVMVRTAAAAALGELAPRGDARSIAALTEAMSAIGEASRETRWNAAIALARLGDDVGVEFVVDVLLSRASLAAMPAGELSADPDATMPAAAQDRLMISTLVAAAAMTDERIRAKIQQVAESDPSSAVRAAASKVLSGLKADPAGADLEGSGQPMN